MEEVFSVVFHPCETLSDYNDNKYSYEPYFKHHFFDFSETPVALKYVQYDIYYIVDTFELFICVKGQIHKHKDLALIYQAIVVVYDSIFSKLPDNSLVLSEDLFKNCLSFRESDLCPGFIPPGRILVEDILDDGSIFQLRYCKFRDEDIKYESFAGNVSDENREESECPNFVNIYLPNNSSSRDLDMDVLSKHLGNIYETGHFDNDIIFDIIKHKHDVHFESSHVERFHVNRKLDFSNYQNFVLLHRRMEWFLHWFIECASNIDNDHRWTIYIPLIIQPRTPIDPEKHKPGNDTSIFMQSNENLKDSILSRLDGKSSYDLHLNLMNQRIGKVSDLFDFGNANGRSDKLLYSVQPLGIATTFTSFTLNLYRVRISQFMILPKYANKGFGLRSLEFIYRMLIMDNNIRMITVEDPTPIFSVLRCIIALKICFDSTLISSDLLYGADCSNLNSGIFSNNLPKRSYISSICKESKVQASRLIEILELALIISKPAPNNCDPDCTNKRKKIARIGDESGHDTLPDYKDYYDKLMKRIKDEEMKIFAKNVPSLQISHKNNDDNNKSFEKMCNDIISDYIRVIQKLRKMYPKVVVS